MSELDIKLMAHNDCCDDWNDLNYKECWVEGYIKGGQAVQSILKQQLAASEEAGKKAEAELARLRGELARLRGQKPVAWVIGPMDCDLNGWIPCKAYTEGEFTTPLYAKPVPPADVAKTL